MNEKELFNQFLKLTEMVYTNDARQQALRPNPSEYAQREALKLLGHMYNVFDIAFILRTASDPQADDRFKIDMSFVPKYAETPAGASEKSSEEPAEESSEELQNE